MSAIKTIAFCAGLFMASGACSHSSQSEGKSKQDSVYGESSSRGGVLDSWQERKDYAPGDILVKFHQGTDRKTIEAIQQKLSLRVVRIFTNSNLYLMKIEDGSSVEEVIRRLTALPEVSHAEPNFKVQIQPK